MAVLQILGKPEEKELYKRNQRYFMYYISPGPMCGKGLSQDAFIEKVQIRFSALNTVTEVNFIEP